MTTLDLADSCRPRLSHTEAKRIAFREMPRLRSLDWRVYQLADCEIKLFRRLFAEAAKGPELPGIIPEPAPQTFLFDRSRVRIIDREGAPWFIVVDVCEALGIRNASDAISRLSNDERSTIGNPESRNGGGKLLVVSESGLYGLVLRCQGATTEGTPAYRFSRWVTHEVLPSIRREGAYVAPVAIPKAPEKSEAPAPRLPAGAQLRELRLMGEKGLVSAAQIQRLLGVAGTPVVTPEEPKASPELGAAKFAEIRERLGAGGPA